LGQGYFFSNFFVALTCLLQGMAKNHATHEQHVGMIKTNKE
jgi:hypothetical protein